MTDKQALLDLADRVEKGQEDRRYLDCEVWVALCGKGERMKIVGPPTYNPLRLFCNPSPEIDWIGYDLYRTTPEYTTSLNAAHALHLAVCPEWTFVNIMQFAGGWFACLERNQIFVTAKSKEETTARCAAILRAKAEETDDGEV